MKIMLADSGATKTDWAYIEDGKPVYVRTSGLHPYYLDPEQVYDELHKTIGAFQPDVIRFYGAGCVSEVASAPVRRLLKRLFGEVTVEITGDLTAVAHAFLSHGDGVAAILGTGSSSGRFQGGNLVEQVPSLGYVLGDEGSACDIARRILRSLLRGKFSSGTVHYLEENLGITDYTQLTTQLYRSDRPSYYLGQLTERILGGDYPGELRTVVDESFQSFVDRHLVVYEGYPVYDLVIAGGLANSLKSILVEILAENDIEHVSIQHSIISALAERFIASSKP